MTSKAGDARNYAEENAEMGGNWLFIKFNLKNKKTIIKFYNPRKFFTDIKLRTLLNKILTDWESDHIS